MRFTLSKSGLCSQYFQLLWSTQWLCVIISYMPGTDTDTVTPANWALHHPVIVFVQFSLWCKIDSLHSNNGEVDDGIIKTASFHLSKFSGRIKWENFWHSRNPPNFSLCTSSCGSLQNYRFGLIMCQALCFMGVNCWNNYTSLFLIRAVRVFLYNQILSSCNRIADKIQ